MRRIVALVVVVAGVLLGLASCRVVPAGHVGVRDWFGNVAAEPLSSGLCLVRPLTRVHALTVRTCEVKESTKVPSSEGLLIGLDVSVVYHVEPDRAVALYREVGLNYMDVVVVPQLRSVIRAVTARNEAKALYGAQREAIADAIKGELAGLTADRGIIIDQVLVRDIEPPEQLRAAIETKLVREQEAEQMKFVLDRERQEAGRKKIEAEGIATFQRIVTEGISEPLLRWKGIEATQELAKSPNSKVVIIGAGQNGLPLILNQ